MEDVEFYTKNYGRRRKDGSTYSCLSTYCKECHIQRAAARSRAHYSERGSKIRKNRALMRRMKDVPCADCGNRFHPVCMDFDHRDPALKTRGLAAMAHQSTDTILVEIAKCDVVCANCHRIRTARVGGWMEYE
jgi:hypothetical protein